MTDDELAAFDALRLPGESRSAVVRRLLNRVTYAADVARAMRGEGSAPAPDDPRRADAAGTSVVVDLGPLEDDPAPEYAVIDSESGVVLHESTERPLAIALTPKATAPAGSASDLALGVVRALALTAGAQQREFLLDLQHAVGELLEQTDER